MLEWSSLIVPTYIDTANYRTAWPWSRVIPAFCAALILSATGCCPTGKQMEPPEPAGLPIPSEVRDPQYRIIGWSVEDRPIECRILGDGPDVTLFIGTIHGNEPSGTPLIRRLADYLAERLDLLDGRQVILIPALNPDGMVRHSRFNARNVDLNRNFPVGNWKPDRHSGQHPLSEPESQILHDLLHIHQPCRVITIHETLACIDYDGPGEALARAMAACSDLPVRRLGGLPGSLGSYVGMILHRPIITIELRRFAHRLPEAELWNRYRDMLLAAITFEDNRTATAGDVFWMRW